MLCRRAIDVRLCRHVAVAEICAARSTLPRSTPVLMPCVAAFPKDVSHGRYQAHQDCNVCAVIYTSLMANRSGNSQLRPVSCFSLVAPSPLARQVSILFCLHLLFSSICRRDATSSILMTFLINLFQAGLGRCHHRYHLFVARHPPTLVSLGFLPSTSRFPDLRPFKQTTFIPQLYFFRIPDLPWSFLPLFIQGPAIALRASSLP